MLLAPFVHVIGVLLDLYRWVIIAHIVLQLLVYFQIINSYQPLVRRITTALYSLAEPILGRVRRLMPQLPGVDVSPVVVLILLGFLKELAYTLLYRFEDLA